MLYVVLIIIFIIILIILLSPINLTLSCNVINNKYNGYVRISILKYIKITRNFDDEFKLSGNKDKNEDEVDQNYIVELFGNYVKDDDVNVSQIKILFNGVLDLFDITKDKVKISKLELGVDYSLEDAALTSLSYGVFSAMLGIIVSTIKNNNVVKGNLRVKIMPHFKNSSFLSSTILCIFSVNVGNIIITGIRILLYLNRIKKKLKES